MEKNFFKEILIILLASIILSISYIYPSLESNEFFLKLFGMFILVLGVNIITKKIVARTLDINIETKWWSVYYYGFLEKKHFNKPLPMIFLPIVLSIFSGGFLQWFPILEFEEKARVERVAKRYELYRFSSVTEWHSGLIAFFGLFSNLVLFFIFLFFNQIELGKISLFYSIWLLLPFSRLDGSKILFGSRKLWVFSCVLILVSLIVFSLSF